MDGPRRERRDDVGEHTCDAGTVRVCRSGGMDLARHAVDLRTRHRPGYTLLTHLCSWDVVVFRVEPSTAGPAIFVAKAHGEVRGFIDDVDAGRRDADLVATLRRPPRRALRRPPGPRQQLRTGVEHEYLVLGPSGRVDVRTLVDGLDLGVRADPTDPHAQRCAWGGVVTADGREAEVATPPVDVAAGAAAEVVALAAMGRSVLATALGALTPSRATAPTSTSARRDVAISGWPDDSPPSSRPHSCSCSTARPRQGSSSDRAQGASSSAASSQTVPIWRSL